MAGRKKVRGARTFAILNRVYKPDTHRSRSLPEVTESQRSITLGHSARWLWAFRVCGDGELVIAGL